MHRRSFLSMLGLAPVVAVAPMLAKSTPSFAAGGLVGEVGSEAVLPLARVSGPLIMEGAITADKISGATITANKLEIGSIIPGKVKAVIDSIDKGKFSANRFIVDLDRRSIEVEE